MPTIDDLREALAAEADDGATPALGSAERAAVGRRVRRARIRTAAATATAALVLLAGIAAVVAAARDQPERVATRTGAKEVPIDGLRDPEAVVLPGGSATPDELAAVRSTLDASPSVERYATVADGAGYFWSDLPRVATCLVEGDAIYLELAWGGGDDPLGLVRDAMPRGVRAVSMGGQPVAVRSMWRDADLAIAIAFDAPAESASRLRSRLRALDGVASASHVSRDQAVEDYIALHGEWGEDTVRTLPDLIEGYVEVRAVPGADLTALVQQVEALPEVQPFSVMRPPLVAESVARDRGGLEPGGTVYVMLSDQATADQRRVIEAELDGDRQVASYTFTTEEEHQGMLLRMQEEDPDLAEWIDGEGFDTADLAGFFTVRVDDGVDPAEVGDRLRTVPGVGDVDASLPVCD